MENIHYYLKKLFIIPFNETQEYRENEHRLSSRLSYARPPDESLDPYRILNRAVYGPDYDPDSVRFLRY